MKRLFTLVSLILVGSAAFAQIPNPGFETWTTVGSYHMPTGWDNPNPTTNALIPPVYTCDSAMDAPPQGLAYIKLTAKSTLLGTVPGVAVTGQIVVSGTSYTVKGGIVNTTRPANFTGKWRHMPQGSDHARLGVYLWRWNATLNKRDTIAKADSTLTGMEMTWASFSIPFKYYSGTTPDSALVVLSSSASSSSATAGSYLWADDLAFTGSVPNGIVSVSTPNGVATLFPNPATDNVTVYYHSTSGGDITINVTDLSGKVVRTINPRAISGENNFPLSLKGIAQGLYFVQIVDEHGMLQKKLVVE